MTTYGSVHQTNWCTRLAGCHLISRRDRERLAYALAGEGDYWSEAILLGAEELHYNREMEDCR